MVQEGALRREQEVGVAHGGAVRDGRAVTREGGRHSWGHLGRSPGGQASRFYHLLHVLRMEAAEAKIAPRRRASRRWSRGGCRWSLHHAAHASACISDQRRVT
eukprot:scaffold424_cov69-Phaeocystis_antarctica.AAC.14